MYVNVLNIYMVRCLYNYGSKIDYIDILYMFVFMYIINFIDREIII